MYHYLECGLPNVYLVNGIPWLDSIDGLHMTIGKLLAQKAGSLGGREIRFLRREMGLTQKGLGEKLDTSCRTVQRWEQDRNRVTHGQDVLLRTLYLGFIGRPCSMELISRVMSVNDQDTGMIILERHRRQWYLSPRKNLSPSTV